MSENYTRHQEFGSTQEDALATQPTTCELVIPVLAEELVIEKQVVHQASVHFTKLVHEQPQMIHELLQSEQINVERVPRNEIVTEPPAVRVEGDVTIIPVIEEVLVVTKQLRLKEELRLVKSRITTEHHQQVSLRSEELVVERSNPNQESQKG